MIISYFLPVRFNEFAVLCIARRQKCIVFRKCVSIVLKRFQGIILRSMLSRGSDPYSVLLYLYPETVFCSLGSDSDPIFL